MSDQVLPLLQTTWGQDGVYAQLVTDLGTWTNDNIGCQCLALAQILFYHRLQPHQSEASFYTCSKEGQPDRIVNLVFGENYFFPFFPNRIISNTRYYQRLPVQSYLFDVAKAFRKKFYRGYAPPAIRDRVKLLTSHFNIEAKFYSYSVGESRRTPSNRRHEDLDGDSRRTIDDAKLLIKRELSNSRPLWMRINRESGTDDHAVVVDGFKEEDDGTFLICVKWGDPSRYNSDSDNPNNPPWFDLEGDIGNRDGTMRDFISIRPKRQSS